MRTMRLSVLAAVTALTMGAVLHPSAVLRSPVSAIEAGAKLELVGEEFSAGEATALLLRGPLAEYELREVTPGEDGTFKIDLPIPGDVRPGQYRLVALASDGDVSASLDLTVLMATSKSSDDGDEHAEEGDHEEMGAMGARADEMPIERSRAGVEWGVIGLLIGLAGGGGAILVLRA
jgi:hypothetical protein